MVMPNSFCDFFQSVNMYILLTGIPQLRRKMDNKDEIDNEIVGYISRR